jgi:hypothetical protein
MEEPDYGLLNQLFYEVINTHCANIPYDYDWNNKMKSSTNYEVELNLLLMKTTNSSMALGNANISQSSPNNSDLEVDKMKENMSIYYNRVFQNNM